MRLTDRVDRMVTETLDAVAMGDTYDHEVTLTYQPGPGGPTPALVILIVGRGIAMDQVIGAAPALIPSPAPAQDVVAAHVRQAVASIQAERARQSRQIPLLGAPR